MYMCTCRTDYGGALLGLDAPELPDAQCQLCVLRVRGCSARCVSSSLMADFVARPSRERGRDGRRQAYLGTRHTTRTQGVPDMLCIFYLFPLPDMGAPQNTTFQRS